MVKTVVKKHKDDMDNVFI